MKERTIAALVLAAATSTHAHNRVVNWGGAYAAAGQEIPLYDNSHAMLTGDDNSPKDGCITGTEWGQHLLGRPVHYRTGHPSQYGRMGHLCLDETSFAFPLGRDTLTKAVTAVQLQVEAFASYASPPAVNTLELYGGEISRIDFAPPVKAINTSGESLFIEDILFSVPASGALSVSSDARPVVEAADSLTALAKNVKEAIRIETYPIHVPPHSEVFLRPNFRLQCRRGPHVLTYGKDPTVLKSQIPLLFGMTAEERYVRALPFAISFVTNGGRVDYDLVQLILIEGKDIRVRRRLPASRSQ